MRMDKNKRVGHARNMQATPSKSRARQNIPLEGSAFIKPPVVEVLGRWFKLYQNQTSLPRAGRSMTRVAGTSFKGALRKQWDSRTSSVLLNMSLVPNREQILTQTLKKLLD